MCPNEKNKTEFQDSRCVCALIVCVYRCIYYEMNVGSEIE